MIELIKKTVEQSMPEIIKIRHKIHQNPELSFEEYNTANIVCGVLDKMGIEYKSEIAGTGILGIIRGERQSGNPKTVLIRADMDALPVTERTELKFKSQNNGVMHACGHDVHTSVLLCCAVVLSKLKDKFSGSVKLMFQPGEETTGGAEPMIDAGILCSPDVDSCVALHIEPSLNVGMASFKAGAAYSCPDEFFIKIKGKGGHAAAPHECIDPIVIAAQTITMLQTIPSRLSNPFNPMVVSVCAINGGSAYNIIPNEVTLRGTARSFSDSDRNMLEEKIELAVRQVCAMYGADYEYNFDRLFPPLINDTETINALKTSAQNYLEPENIITATEPTMAGEDFSYLTRAVKSSALFWLGSTPNGYKKYPLHNERLIADDECIKYGAEIFTDYVLNFLSN